MPTLTEVNRQYAAAHEFSALVRTSQEISIMQIQRIRTEALATRSYMDGLRDIFFDVRSAQQQQTEEMLKERSLFKVQQKEEARKKPSVIIFLSTNARFSGALTPKIFDAFAAAVRHGGSDVIVVGRIGKELVDQYLKIPHLSIEFVGDTPTDTEIKDLINRLLTYNRIDVYQGQYMSLADQQPQVINISGNTVLQYAAKTSESIPRMFLFEPSLEQIVAFFEAQITASLFRLTLQESRLANLGSRITALESSLLSLDQEVSKLKRKKQILIRRNNNKKQLQRLAGSRLWS